MKTFFIHDTIFVKYKNDFYTKDGLDNEVFDTYKHFFDDIYIFARYEDFSEKNKIYIKDENKIKNVNFFCGKTFRETINILKKEYKQADFYILRVHSFIGCFAYRYILKSKKKYLVESVSCAWDCLWNHSLKGKILSPFVLLMTKHIIRKARYVLYVSNFLKRRYPTRGKYLICSDVRLRKLQKKQYSVGAKLNEINICTIANVDVKYKGHKYVIKALNKLKNSGITYRYHMVGGGTGKRLKKLISRYKVEDQIDFVGPIPHALIFNYLKKMDLYIQPSNAESHGRVILEAQSIGVPTIGSSTGGIPEIVNHNYVFKRKKYNDLVEKIRKISFVDELESQSTWSYENATNFLPQKLNLKRNEFYKMIKEDIK